MTALDVFYPERMASRILGMGDMLTLIEKAQQDFDQKKAEELADKMRENTFDFNDFIEKNFSAIFSLHQFIKKFPVFYK